MRGKGSIPVFFTIDGSYVDILSVALHSLFDNADRSRSYEVVIIHENLGEEDIRRLEAIDGAIRLVRMDESLAPIKDRSGNRLRCDYFTLTIFFRIFIAEMFPEYDKGIYLDSDIVVPGDVSRLYDIPLDGQTILAACPDFSIQHIQPLVDYVEKAVGVPRLDYFNSGVLLMNLDLMRRKDLAGHFLDLLERWHFDSIAPDQDYLNAICRGHVKHLPQEWDTMPVKGSAPLQKPSLIHYNLFDKPWLYSGVQYEEVFWHYARKSGLEERFRAMREDYRGQERDRESLERMLAKAVEIPRQEDTFLKVGQRGGRIGLW